MKPLAILLSAVALAGSATDNETKWIYEPSGAWHAETNAVVVEPAGAERIDQEVIVVPETDARDINQHPYTQPFGIDKYPSSRVKPQPQMDLDEDDEPRHLDQHIL